MPSPQMTAQQSFNVLSGGQSQKIAMSTVSAASTLISAPFLVVSVDAACFVRSGASPTAVNDGTDQYLVANAQYRFPWSVENGLKIAFIMASGTGNAYVTPGV